MSSGGGGTSEYWPGFVDALTNVVIAMVFVIVVLAIALSFSMQMLAQRMATKVAELQQAVATANAAAASQPALAPPVEAAAPVAVAPPPIDTPLPAPVPSRLRIAVAGNERAASAPAARVTPAATSLVLDYAPGALTLDEGAAKALVQALPPLRESLVQGPAGSRIALVASGPSMDLSDNQRAAFIRLMAVRNALLEQGVEAGRIVTRIDPKIGGDAPRIAVTLEAAP